MVRRYISVVSIRSLTAAASRSFVRCPQATGGGPGAGRDGRRVRTAAAGRSHGSRTTAYARRMPAAPDISIPADLLPADGRFGSGPSKVRAEQVEALAAAGRALLGPPHRQQPVRSLVGRVRAGLAELFALPDGYQVVLGNGGSTAFWDVATVCLVRERAQHAVFGEFGAKFAAATTRAPFLQDSSIRSADPGSVALPALEEGVDVYAWPHNETSTGVMAPVERVVGADDGALVLIDATSGAGGLPFDLT